MKQILNLTEGKYELKFDFAPRKGYSLGTSSFTIFFNGIEVLKVRPGLPGKVTITHTLIGMNGDNVL